MSQAATAIDSGRARWLVILAALGVFFAADDQTSVVAILPAMVEGVGVAQDEFYRAAWIVNGYILGYVVAMPLMGRVADALGHGRIYAAALLLFCAGSVLVALSGNLTTLTVARGVQAIGGGAVVPIAMAIVMTTAAPGRRALGLGAMAAASEAGALLGPLWGGGIADVIGWRGVFWINLPLCLPLAALVWRYSLPTRREKLSDPAHPEVHPEPGRRALEGGARVGHSRIDYPGAALLGLSLVALTVALTDDPIQPRSTGVTLALLVASALLFGLFLLRQRQAATPIVDLSIFRRLPLSAAFLTNALTGAALIVAMVNVPLFTSIVLLGSPLEGGLNLMRLTIALAGGALLGGVLAGRVGLAPAACLGLVLAGAGFVGMTRWDEEPSFVVMTLPLLVAGLGFGLIIAPINAAALGQSPDDQHATVASLLTVVRLLGALVAVALLTTRGLGGFYAEAGLVPLDDPRFVELLRGIQVESFRETFVAAAVVCFVSLIPAAMLGRRNK